LTHPIQKSTQALVACVLALGAQAASCADAGAADATQTPADLVDGLHVAFGVHHARAVHAKGTQGSFTPAPEARQLTSATAFAGGTVAVTARFSDFTGIPDIPDTLGAANPRGFAIKLHLSGGGSLDVVTHSFNGFPTRTSYEFAQLLRSIGTSGKEAMPPTDLDKFLASHPIAKTFLTTQKPPPPSYATASYFGVKAFSFVDAKGQRHDVRYRFVPAAGEHWLDDAALKAAGPDYLQTEIADRIASRQIAFTWYAQVAQAGDVLDDPSIAWPDSRKLVKLGTVTLTSLEPDQAKVDKGLLFLPGQLPQGIEIDGPMIAMRNAAYPISFGARQ
jgi:catalase